MPSCPLSFFFFFLKLRFELGQGNKIRTLEGAAPRPGGSHESPSQLRGWHRAPWQAFNKLLVILTDPRTHLFCLRCMLRNVQWQVIVLLVFKENSLGCVTKNFSDFTDFGHESRASKEVISRWTSASLCFGFRFSGRFTLPTGPWQLQPYNLPTTSTARIPAVLK